MSPWGQGYAVISAPFILESLAHALGPFLWQTRDGSGCWVYTGLSPGLRLCPDSSACFPPLAPGTLSHTTLHPCPISQCTQDPSILSKDESRDSRVHDHRTAAGPGACLSPPCVHPTLCLPLLRLLSLISLKDLKRAFLWVMSRDVLVPGGWVCVSLAAHCGHSRLFLRLLGGSGIPVSTSDFH